MPQALYTHPYAGAYWGRDAQRAGLAASGWSMVLNEAGQPPPPGPVVTGSDTSPQDAVAALAELVRDTVAAALQQGAGVTITVDDSAETITVSATGTVLSVAGRTGAVTLDKTDVGLTAVDNTSDALKPVSGPQQTALNAKAALVHGHTSAAISDFVEAAQDAVAALLGAGSNITLNYDDVGNLLTVTAAGAGGSGLDAEAVRDAIGVAMIGVGRIAVTVNDDADTITISTTATANSTDAALRDRTTHTGEQPQSSVTGLPTALAAKARKLTRSADIRTGTYTAADGEMARVDPTNGSFTGQLPAPTDGARIGIKDVRPTSSTSTGTVTLLNPDGTTALVLRVPGQTRVLIADGTAWETESADPIASYDMRYARSSVPPAAGSRAGSYVAPRSLYTPAPSAGAKLRAALAKAATGGLVQWTFIGDSKTAGFNAGPINSYPSRLRALLAAQGVPSAGTGCVPTSHINAIDSRWATTGTWTEGWLYSTSVASGNSKTFTSDVAGTIVEIWYFNTTAPLSVSIDGGAAQTITGTGAATVGKFTATGLTSTTHTVTITTTSASASYIIGACVRGATGLLVHNLGCTGSATATWIDTSTVRPTAIAAGIAASPDIVSIAIGTNDAGSDVPPATYAANLATMTAKWPNAARLLIVQTPRTGKTWEPYVAAQYDRADADAALLLDLTDRWGSAANALSIGMLGTDQLHETGAGHMDVARALAAAA